MKTWQKRLGIGFAIFGVLVVLLIAYTAYQTKFRTLARDAAPTVETADYVFVAPHAPVQWVTGCERFERRCIGVAPRNNEDYWWTNRREWLEVIPLDGGGAESPAELVERARESTAALFGVQPAAIELALPGTFEYGGTLAVALMGPKSSRYSPVRVAQLPDGRLLQLVCHIESVADVSGQQESCEAALDAVRFPEAEALAQHRAEEEQRQVLEQQRAEDETRRAAAAKAAAMVLVADAPRSFRYPFVSSKTKGGFSDPALNKMAQLMERMQEDRKRLTELAALWPRCLQIREGEFEDEPDRVENYCKVPIPVYVMCDSGASEVMTLQPGLGVGSHYATPGCTYSNVR